MAEISRMQRIEEMLAQEPNDPELRYMLAMEHVSAGDDAKAVRVFEQLVTLAADYPPGYHQGARALVRLNRIAEARTLLQRGIPAALNQGNQHAAGEMQELLQSLEDS